MYKENKDSALRPKHGKEYAIQKQLIEYLEARGWLVERLIGNAYQYGLPDLYCHHPKWGYRWIDLKVEGKYSFTKRQKQKWPKWEKFGVGIWILTGADQNNYNKLFKPPNWRSYWKSSWGTLTQAEIDELLDKITL